MTLEERKPQLAGEFDTPETRTTVLFETSHALLSPVGIESALQTVAGTLEAFLPVNGVLIALLENGAPRILAMAGMEHAASELHFEAVARPVFERVKASGKSIPFHQDEAHRMCDDCDPVHGDPLCRFLGVPVRRKDELVGVLMAEDRDEHRDEAGTRKLLGMLSLVARLIGQAFHFQEVVTRDRNRLMQEGHRAHKQLASGQVAHRSQGELGIVGESPLIQEVLRKIQIAARSDLPVLLRGESGTGKELFAQAVHALSNRSHGPMVRLNCAALSETMLESELFGHEKGAFTGAMNQRKGRFELADGGTLFLDEIGEISAGFQSKLLRVLQEGEFERVGGAETLKVDVRVVAATNRDLEDDVRKGTFRSDLYFRLCVVPIQLAPLRERAEDIPLLAKTFLSRFNESNGTRLDFDRDALDLMQGCAFPGNIRELESCVRRTAAFCTDGTIHAKDFACRNDSCLSMLLAQPRAVPKGFQPLPIVVHPAHPAAADARFDPRSQSEVDSQFDAGSQFDTPSSFDDEEDLSHASPERHRLLEAMERSGWVQAKAARLLGLTPRQVCYALRKHGIEVKKF